MELRRLASFAAFLLFFLLPAVALAEGMLYVAHDPEARVFPLTHTEVKSEIDGDVISTSVTQRFKNPYSERIEAVYIFPLPNRAAVDAMEMRIGKRTVRADVRRRTEAQAAYDAAARTGRRAALLEQERPNVFTFSVANIEPGGEIQVALHYFEIAKYDHGTYEMVFPMVVGPRYVPGKALTGAQTGTGTRTDTDRVPDASRISPAYVPPGQPPTPQAGTREGRAITISARLDAGAPIESIDSPAHEVDVSRVSPSVAEVKLHDKAEIANRDFVLRWRMAAPGLKAALFAYHADAKQEGYVALLLEPKHDATPAEIAPREMVFLIDTSGSMRGTPLATAIAAMKRAVSSMQPNDTFQIVDFADTASTFASRPLSNTPENVRRSVAYLDRLSGTGGTNQLAGIHAALAPPPDVQGRLRIVMFMTDGYIGNDVDVIRLVKSEIGRARIFGFGVGSSVNRYLLDEVSYVGRGAAEYLRPNEDAKEMVERFYERIARPYLTDVTVEWEGLQVTDVVPSALPDVSALQPLVVFAKYRAAGKGGVVVRGKVAGRPFEQRIAVALPDVDERNVALERVWAREKIGELMRHERRAGEEEVAITELGLAHHLVTPYTSLVAIDDTAPPAGKLGFPMLIHQPSESPEGVDMGSAGAVYATAPPPAPPPPSAPQEAAVYARRGGCAGCTASATRAPWTSAMALGTALLLLLALRRRRGERT
jgi:Ca-activated chloride channel family protein